MRKPDRIEAIKNVLRVLSDARPGISVFACAVHKDSFSHSDPIKVAFEDICRRFDRQLSRFYHANDNQRGLLILDNTYLKNHLRNLANDFNMLGTRWGPIKNIIECPLFLDSRASRLMQLADHVANAVYRRYEYGDTLFFDIFAHRIDSDGDTLHSISHKHQSLTNCRCIACIRQSSSSLPNGNW